MVNLSPNKICCGLKKVVAKIRAQVYLEQQILALLLVFHQTHNLSLETGFTDVIIILMEIVRM